MIIDDYIKSAIIGYWRCGAKPIEIARITRLPEEKIEEIISTYKIKNQNGSEINI